jgi:hypothetical protein
MRSLYLEAGGLVLGCLCALAIYGLAELIAHTWEPFL